jgi:uncharacterized protein
MTTLLEASATGLVPIFALPDVCLLPGESLPFHVFEPRYRRMLADALEGERLIALARLQPGFEATYEGNPAVYPCMGVGEIAAHRPHGNGASEVVLRGIARARLCEVVKTLPYRLGRLVDLPETCSSAESESELRAALGDVLEPLRSDFARANCALEQLIAAPDVVWRIGLLLHIDVAAKQSLLESDDQVERLSLVLREVTRDLQRARIKTLLRHLASRPATPQDESEAGECGI